MSYVLKTCPHCGFGSYEPYCAMCDTDDVPFTDIQLLGFRDEEDLIWMTSLVDMSTPEKRIAFKKWQNEDGTKDGMLLLPRIKV